MATTTTHNITTDHRSPATPAKTGMDPKTRNLIGVGALVFCLLVGGGIVYWLLFSGPSHKTIKVTPEQQAAAGATAMQRQVQMARREVRGVFEQDGEWIVRGTAGEMRFKSGSPNAAAATFRFPEGLKLAPEQVALLAGRYRILHDEAMAKEWQVTPQQLEQLKKLEMGATTINPPAADRAAIWQIWGEYEKAAAGPAKVTAQQALVAKVDEVARAQFEPARQAYGARIEQISKILTPQQIAQITKG